MSATLARLQSTRMEFFKTLPENFFKVEGGSYTYGRPVFGASHKLGSGNLLYGGEETYYDGPWTHPDGFNKINGLLTYSRATTPTAPALRPAVTTGNGTRAIKSPLPPKSTHTIYALRSWLLRHTEPD